MNTNQTTASTSTNVPATGPDLRVVAVAAMAALLFLASPGLAQGVSTPAASTDPSASPWPGSWYVNPEGAVDASAGIPATIDYEGTTAEDASEAWSYTITTSAGVQYECDYLPGRHDDNIGDGLLVPPGEKAAIRGTCSFVLPPLDGPFANYAFANFTTDGYCIPDQPPVECESSLTDVGFDGAEVGIFNVARDAGGATSPDALHAVGDWWWSTEVSTLESLLRENSLVADRGELLFDEDTGDWLFRGQRGTLVCIQDTAFFYPWASPLWWPLSGDCQGHVSTEGNNTFVHTEATFSAGSQPKVVDQEASVQIRYLGGCGDFLVTGDGELVDTSHWYDELTKPSVEYEDGTVERLHWGGQELVLETILVPLQTSTSCSEA